MKNRDCYLIEECGGGDPTFGSADQKAVRIRKEGVNQGIISDGLVNNQLVFIS